MMTKEKRGARAKATAAPSQRSDELDRELDDALEATFPSSDPVSVGDETGDEPAKARKDRQTPPLDEALVEKLAEEVKRTTSDD